MGVFTVYNSLPVRVFLRNQMNEMKNSIEPG